VGGVLGRQILAHKRLILQEQGVNEPIKKRLIAGNIIMFVRAPLAAGHTPAAVWLFGSGLLS
jgi:hypothetical protein